jgi:putative ABC transport system permease protein
MRLLNWLIAKTAPADERDALIGDLMEEYEQRVRPSMGPIRARLWYVRQALLACAHGRRGRVRSDRATPGRWVAEAGRDLMHAARGLRHAPGFTLASIVSLAVGIGASTAIFSVANPVLFQALPYPDATRVLMISYVGGNGGKVPQAFGTYREVVERGRVFAALAATKPWQPALVGQDEPERLEGQRVSARYFEVLGVRPSIGVTFDAAEDRPGGANLAVIADRLWRRRFAADPGIIGRRILLNDFPYTVVGVMPASFEDVLSPRAEIWGLLQYNPTLPPDGREWGHHLSMVGRLAVGVDVDAARQDLDRIARAPVAEFSRPSYASLAQGFIVTSLQDDLAGPVKPVLVAVIGGVVLLLAIACLNVANLLFARGGQRQGEVTLRSALGAGRARLVRQFVTESVLLAMIGGGAGLLVAAAGVQALVALGPPDLPRLGAIALDTNVFAFCAATAALVGLLVGLAPAWQTSRAGLQHQGYRGSTGGGRAVVRRALVVAEVALAGMLLVGAGLLLRSVDRLFAIAPGFDASRVVTMQVQVASRKYSSADAMNDFYTRALEAVQRVPGVTSAAYTSQLPLSGDSELYGVSAGSPAADAQPVGGAFRYAVTPAYFNAMRIPLMRGRLFDERDMAPGAERPVIINQSFAAAAFKGEDPIGRYVRAGGPSNRPWDVVVGVVGDVKQLSLASQADAFYVTTSQWLWPDNPRWLVVRAAGDPAALVPSIKAAVWSVDANQPIVREGTMDSVLARSASTRRFALVLFEAFGLVALLLAATGLYGVLSGSVTARAREMGVRSALGATRPVILAMVFREGLTLTAIGAVTGLGAGALASTALTSLLFEVTRLDAWTYVGVAAVLAGVSAIACWLPASRAAGVDPLIALRSE